MEDKRCLFLKEEIIEDEVDPMGNSQNNCAKNFMSTEEGLVVLSLVRELLEYIGLEFTSGAFDAEIEAYKSYEYVGRERLALDLNLDAEKKGPLISQVLQVSKVMSSTESHEETRFSEANIKIECVDECENAINRHSPKFQEVVLKPECNPEELDLKPECSPDEMGQLDLRQVESSAVADSDEGVSQDPLSTEDISLQDRPTTTRSNCYKKQKTTCNWPEPFPSFGNLVQPSTSHGLPSDESNIEVIKRESISLEDSPSTSGPVIDLSSVFSLKGKKHIVKDNFTFRSNATLKSGEELWRCCNWKCTARLYTLEEGKLFARQEGEHNHEHTEQNKLWRKVISNSIKRKAGEDIADSPSKLIHAEIARNALVLESLTRKDLKCIRDNIINARLKQFPKLPKSKLEAQEAFSKLEIKTPTGEDFLLVNDTENKIAIFSCDTNLAFLCERETLLMDGTFDYSPKHFTQLFTIHGYSDGTYIPLVYCLLSDVKKKTYSQVLGIVKEQCKNRNLQLLPSKIVVDFELAIHQSIAEVFSGSSIVGCRFHLGQAWQRKIQQLGLSSIYKDTQSEAGKWLNYCFGIAYLSPEEVEDAFCDLIAIQPANEKLTRFADFLTYNYVGRNSLFPPQLWAADTTELWRRTNTCESFHSRFNQICPSPHPNIFIFIKNLKSIQLESHVVINSQLNSAVPKSRKNMCLQQDFIQTKISHLKNGDIDRLSFIKCVGYKLSTTNV